MFVLIVLVVGFSVVLMMILVMGLVECVVDLVCFIEGLIWVIIGLGIGMVLGLVLVGWVVEGYGFVSGFFVVVGVGWLVWLLVLVCFWVLV